MLLKSRTFRILYVVCLSLSLTVFVFADTIRLKNGSIIKGKIVSFNNGKFTVLIDDGARQRQFNFSAEEIESITFDSNTSQFPTNPPANSQTDPNTTIINVGQNKSGNNDPLPKKTPPVIKTDTSGNSNPSRNTNSGNIPPLIINVSVLADNTANGWTNSGYVVRKGQKIKIKASGRVSLGKGRRSNAGGISTLPDQNKLMQNKPTGGLIAVIGADNNDFIFIGESNEFIATRDGDLFLGINEGNLDDNSDSFQVTIEIDSNIGN